MDIEKLLTNEELINFSQNLSPNRDRLGDRIFPNEKTQNLKASFYRLTDQMQLPSIALVHGFDTEARIGERPTFEKVNFEKMLIKEKINLSELVDQYISNGVSSDNAILNYVFDDMGRLAESVLTRVEVMKCELLQSGKVKIKENHIDITLDYGVPSGNTSFSIADMSESADILAEFQKVYDKAKSMGQNIKECIMSTKALGKLRTNKYIQTAIMGTLGQGTLLTTAQINTLMNEMFGFTITTYDEQYKYVKANGTEASKRYIDENKIIFLAQTSIINEYGKGLWGVTPEEKKQGPWTMKSSQQYVTITKWTTPDPVATWTKASGLFVPALYNPNGLFIATATLA